MASLSPDPHPFLPTHVGTQFYAWEQHAKPCLPHQGLARRDAQVNPCVLFLGVQGLRPSTEDNTPMQLFPDIQDLTSPLPSCPSQTHAYCQVTSGPPHETFVMSPTVSLAQPSRLLCSPSCSGSHMSALRRQTRHPREVNLSFLIPPLRLLKPEKSNSPKSHSPGKETHRLDPR